MPVTGFRAPPSAPPAPDLPVEDVRLAVVQRVCTPYRVSLFERLAAAPGIRSRVFHGADLPGTKVRNARGLRTLDRVELPTQVFRVGRRRLVWHDGLHTALAAFRPDVILSEGESNFPSYLQVVLYRRAHPGVRAIHWSLGGLPGRAPGKGWPEVVRRTLQRQFDHYLVYSSFGRRRMLESGHEGGAVTVAVNVADSERHVAAADAQGESRAEARRALGLRDRFTVLYCGSFEPAKRPDVLLDLAADPDLSDVEFIGLGDGPLRDPLLASARRQGLVNVRLPGRVSAELPLYYRASDALLVPGRGGMVISEAMAWSLPVLVHQADGTELDLVESGVTGVRVSSIAEFGTWIRTLAADPDRAAEWGRQGRRRLETGYTTDAMVGSILSAVRASLGAPSSTTAEVVG